MRQLGTGQLQPDRLRAGGEQQLVEAERVAAAKQDAPTPDIERRGRRAEAQLDRVLGIEFGRTQRDPFLGRGAGEIVFRQVRAIIGRRVVRAHDRDTAAKSLAAQHLGRGIARRPAADDDEALGRSDRRLRFRRHAPFGPRHLFVNEDAPVAAFDAPARSRGQCRRRQRFSGAQVEAGARAGYLHLTVAEPPRRSHLARSAALSLRAGWNAQLSAGSPPPLVGDDLRVLPARFDAARHNVMLMCDPG